MIRKHPAILIPAVLVLAVAVFAVAGSTSITLIGIFSPENSSNEIVISGVMQVLIFLLSIGLITIFSKGNLRKYGFKRCPMFPWKGLLTGIVVLQVIFCLPLLFHDLQGDGHPIGEMSFWQTVAIIWLLASVSEEIFTRGLIQSLLTPVKHLGARMGNVFISVPVIVSALVFGLMHLPMLFMGMDIILGVDIVVIAVGLGLLAGYYREKTGSLLPAIAAHMMMNIAGYFTEFMIPG